MTTVKELRDILVECGYSDEDLKGMKKADLVEAVAEAQGQTAEALLGIGDAVEEPEPMYVGSEETEEDATHVGPGDPDWTQFLLSELHEDELAQTDDGEPVVKVNGLRRLTEKHLGRIVEQNVNIVQTPNPDNQWTATSVVRVTVEHPATMMLTSISDAADCSLLNSDKKFSKFPTSMATTRAEARVLRKLLKINVVSEEEMLDNDDEDFDNPGGIQDPQIHMVNAMCTKLGINPQAFVSMGRRKLSDIAEASYREAQQMIQVLNEYQQNVDKIPVDIKE